MRISVVRSTKTLGYHSFHLPRPTPLCQRVQIWVQPYNVLNKPDLKRPVFGSGWALKVQNQVESGRVGPQGQNSGQIRVGLVGFFWLHYSYPTLLRSTWYKEDYDLILF